MRTVLCSLRLSTFIKEFYMMMMMIVQIVCRLFLTESETINGLAEHVHFVFLSQHLVIRSVTTLLLGELRKLGP